MSDWGAAEIYASIDSWYLIVMGCFVFFMQAGFAMLEAGSVQAKNTKNILLKNMLDACLGAVIWFSFGYGVAYGGDAKTTNNGFIGDAYGSKGGQAFFANGWFGNEESKTGSDFAAWFFQYGFAAAAATIVSGAVAERCQLTAYLIYTSVITGFIYPVVVHWVWDTAGWISVFNTGNGHARADHYFQYPVLGGCIDFAGSGVVHMTGGLAALCGAAIIGPRKGRFSDGVVNPMPGHSSVLAVLGTFILWLGWYGFNPGSTLGLTPSGYSQTMARSVVTTTLAAGVGGITVLLIDKMIGSKVWDVSAVCNGVLGGLVSITAGAATINCWHTIIVAMLGGWIYFGSSKLLKKLKIDDPLDAFPVHGACGFWGVLANGMFADPLYSSAFYAWGPVTEKHYNALFYGGGKMFGAAVTALIAEITWVVTLSSIMFLALKFAGLLRVSEEVEAEGMDTSKHGGTAYNMGDEPTKEPTKQTATA